MSTISTIEDTLISTINGLSLFSSVFSLGRKALPEILAYPYVSVFFSGDSDTGSKPRPIITVYYDILVASKNVQSEIKAAKDAYTLINAVRDAINFKTLGIADIEPFICISREITEYKDGVMIYRLKFKTRQYLPVPG